jgi:hypothetical protein
MQQAICHPSIPLSTKDSCSVFIGVLQLPPCVLEGLRASWFRMLVVSTGCNTGTDATVG